MEEEWTVISKSIVVSRNVKYSSATKKIHLTPWDLSRLRFGYLQRGLLKPDSKIDIIISQLQASLSVALDHFYPLAGRLVKVNNNEDDTVSFFISCDDSGVEFVHAVAKNIEVSDVFQLSGSIPKLFSSFFPATGIKNYHGVSRSLLMVQVTEMKDGIFIGFGYNSTVADASSTWKFINAWLEICSNENPNSKTFQRGLVLKGWFFDGIDYPIHIPDPETKVTGYATTTTNLQEMMFHVTEENVLKLEAKANNEAGGLAVKKISSIQAVLGYIWCSMVKHNGMGREEETHCRLPINMRLKLDPPLDEESFGNVSQTGIATATVGELLDHGLGWAAMQINKKEESRTNEDAKAFAENWVTNVKIPVSVGTKDLVVTNSHQFDIYCNDFGWGKPIAARAGPPYPNGRLVVFQGIDKSSLDFQLKAKANDEVSSDDQHFVASSSFSAYVAINSDLNPEEVIHCNILTDIRRRLNPPLKKECFGNVVGFAATTTVAEMLNNGLGWAALQLHKTIGSQTNEEFRKYAENWEKNPKIPNGVAMSNSIIVASSPRFNVYGNDFGWGKPIAVRVARASTSDGKLVYPGNEEGNIEIQTCLSSSVMEKLSSDAEFLENVCVV